MPTSTRLCGGCLGVATRLGRACPELVADERSTRATLPSVASRAEALFDAYAASGTTVIRTHVDVDIHNGVTAVEGVLEAADRLAGRIDIEVVAFPQSGMLIAPETADLLDAAISSGASVVGGIDPAGVDGDAVEHLDVIFGIAEKHGCGVDLHLHDRGALGQFAGVAARSLEPAAGPAVRRVPGP